MRSGDTNLALLLGDCHEKKNPELQIWEGTLESVPAFDELGLELPLRKLDRGFWIRKSQEG